MDTRMVCPDCGSENVSPDTDGFVKRFRNPGVYRCDECGYRGPITAWELEDSEKEDEESWLGDVTGAVMYFLVGFVLLWIILSVLGV